MKWMYNDDQYYSLLVNPCGFVLLELMSDTLTSLSGVDLHQTHSRYCNKHAIKICFSCSWTSATSATHLTTWFLDPFQGKVEDLWSMPCQLKKPFKGSRRIMLLEGMREKRTQYRKVFHRRGVIDLPSKQMDTNFLPMWLPKKIDLFRSTFLSTQSFSIFTPSISECLGSISIPRRMATTSHQWGCPEPSATLI